MFFGNYTFVTRSCSHNSYRRFDVGLPRCDVTVKNGRNNKWCSELVSWYICFSKISVKAFVQRTCISQRNETKPANEVWYLKLAALWATFFSHLSLYLTPLFVNLILRSYFKAFVLKLCHHVTKCHFRRFFPEYLQDNRRCVVLLLFAAQ